MKKIMDIHKYLFRQQALKCEMQSIDIPQAAPYNKVVAELIV